MSVRKGRVLHECARDSDTNVTLFLGNHAPYFTQRQCHFHTPPQLINYQWLPGTEILIIST